MSVADVVRLAAHGALVHISEPTEMHKLVHLYAARCASLVLHRQGHATEMILIVGSAGEQPMTTPLTVSGNRGSDFLIAGLGR
jgi:hypothetical protein